MRTARLFISITILCWTTVSYSQTMGHIDDIVNSIGYPKPLMVDVVKLSDIYGEDYKGGGELKLMHNGSQVKQLLSEGYFSKGRASTAIYYNNGIPIKIVETEEQFKPIEGSDELDYSQLLLTFKEEIYIYEWEMAETETIRFGERVFTEGVCGLFEYEPLVELGQIPIQP